VYAVSEASSFGGCGTGDVLDVALWAIYPELSRISQKGRGHRLTNVRNEEEFLDDSMAGGTRGEGGSQRDVLTNRRSLSNLPPAG
jgi:hypothetical protein